MLGVPAKIAGCKEIVVCSPPQKNGSVNGYIAFVAQLLGIEKIYLAGGAQAVAAIGKCSPNSPMRTSTGGCNACAHNAVRDAHPLSALIP